MSDAPRYPVEFAISARADGNMAASDLGPLLADLANGVNDLNSRLSAVERILDMTDCGQRRTDSDEVSANRHEPNQPDVRSESDDGRLGHPDSDSVHTTCPDVVVSDPEPSAGDRSVSLHTGADASHGREPSLVEEVDSAIADAVTKGEPEAPAAIEAVAKWLERSRWYPHGKLLNGVVTILREQAKEG